VDEPEYEVTDVRSHPLPSAFPDGTQPAPPGTLLSRGWRPALAAGSILLALILIVSVWLPLHTQSHHSTAVVLSPTFPATATPVLTPTPLPITSALGLPPTNCPFAPPLTTVTVAAFDGFYGGPVQLTGHAPVWMVTGYLPPRVLWLQEPTPPSPANPEWPAIPIIWAIGPNAHPTVTVRVHDLQSSTLAWWGTGGESGPQVPILTLNQPTDIPATQSYVAGAPWLLFITRAGCYQMDVTWPGGSWSLIFAAGGIPSS
jgi:hypothetical protein